MYNIHKHKKMTFREYILSEEKKDRRCIAVDLDGTLAHYTDYTPTIGKPISEMIDKVRGWRKSGHEVIIFTARLQDNDEEIKKQIQDWAEENIGERLDATAIKLQKFTEFYDDKAYRVIKNTGKIQ